MALGASPADVVTMVLGHVTMLIALGLVIGMAGSGTSVPPYKGSCS
jgi:hypothetical protein